MLFCSHVTDLKLNVLRDRLWTAASAKEKFQAAIKDVQEKMDAELEDGSDVEGTPMQSPHFASFPMETYGIRSKRIASRGKDIENRLSRKLFQHLSTYQVKNMCVFVGPYFVVLPCVGIITETVTRLYAYLYLLFRCGKAFSRKTTTCAVPGLKTRKCRIECGTCRKIVQR